MKNTMLLKATLICLFISITLTVQAQWTGTSLEFTSSGTPYTKFQFAEHTWSGSHAILFNAYKSVTVNGSLGAPNNTKYANNQGNYGGGAGAIMFFGNGGTMDFMISPAAGASGGGTGINWGTPKMRILRNGEVRIGTAGPGIQATGYLLSVAGRLRAEEVRVETGWADFVFESDYELRTLQEVEAHIHEKGHLPEIPSEAEVSANGIALGEMNAKLLQKIEELTLYLIEQDKQIKVLTEKVSTLENQK